jgi:hypothetical protein
MIPSSRHSMVGAFHRLGGEIKDGPDRAGRNAANRKYRKFLRNRSGFSSAQAPDKGALTARPA